MRKFFWVLFPPYEVQITLRALEDFLSVTSAGISKALVRVAVVRLIKDAERTVYSIRIDGRKPDQLALMLITNVVGAELSSGSHHVYRGTLSMVGDDLVKIWHDAQRQLQSCGYASEAEIKEDDEWLRRQIRSVG